jgi:hypothetical protein
MANPTTNYGWVMPTSTDLVTDLPADFAVFGQAVDTSLADLKGGTTGQVLAKATNTDMDFTWVAQDDSNAIQNTIVDAKGDLISATGSDVPARLAVGNNGETLIADSSTSTGLKWAASASFVGCRLLNSANQTISNNTSTALTFNTESFDTDGFHSTVTNTSRITIPSGKNGKYLLIGATSWDGASATGRRALEIYKNGASIAGSRQEITPTATAFPGFCLSVILDAVATDYFEVFVVQSSGGNLATYGPDSAFSAQFLGA